MKIPLLILAVAACSSRSEPASPAETATDTAAAPVPAAPAPPAPAFALDEVRALLPVPQQARLVDRPAIDESRERVTVSYCFDEGGLEAAAEVVIAKLTDRGWTIERAEAPKGARVRLSGTHTAYAIEGIVQQGPWAHCRADRGQTFVSLSLRSASGASR
jgi:hypothetical protein